MRFSNKEIAYKAEKCIAFYRKICIVIVNYLHVFFFIWGKNSHYSISLTSFMAKKINLKTLY